MIRNIAFIHTVAMLVDRFRPRFQQELPATRCFHMLDESVLQDLLREGPSPSITRRVVALATLAADAGADLIVFTCSSTSPAINVARSVVSVPIVKIDDAMYLQAAQSGGRVGLLCTTTSTLAPSQALLAEHGFACRRGVQAEPLLVEGAFAALSEGRREEHDALVMQAALGLATRVDRLVLAQASLAHLCDPLRAQTGKPVLASPELMISDVVARVAASA